MNSTHIFNPSSASLSIQLPVTIGKEEEASPIQAVRALALFN
ncbi:rCG21991, partial [Rattus norvegicus]